MSVLTNHQRDVRDFILDYEREYGRTPSMTKIAKEFGFANAACIKPVIDALMLARQIRTRPMVDYSTKLQFQPSWYEAQAAKNERMIEALSANVPDAIRNASKFDNIKIPASPISGNDATVGECSKAPRSQTLASRGGDQFDGAVR